ncbi:MAG TPA: hypothetical protein VFF73_18030, partial [Planctomycetota bacterium]|nr:hypothetical protein [Planctomycetota bacterium]
MKIGPYEVQRELSRSSRGVTFAAADPARGAVLLTLVRAHPGEVARFESERKILDALTLADGFVPILDFGSSDQGHYLVQPALPGDSLREVVRAGAGADDLVRLVKGVAAALARAHDRGLVHGDLRPESIHVSEGQPFVVDLALARSFPAEARTSSYAAPEVLRGPPTPRSDVFSLAALAREALQGRESSGVRRALERASSLDEAARFPDARSFLGALGGGALPTLHAMTRVDDSQPSHDAIPTPAAPARRPRGPLLVFGLVAAVALGAFIFEARRRALDASVHHFLDAALRSDHDAAACLALGEALPEAARERSVVRGAIATLRSETRAAEARAAAQAVLAAVPDDARPEARLEAAEKALALDPRSSRALLERARSRLLVGRGDAKKLHAARVAAREDLERALDLAPARLELAFLLLREPDSRVRGVSELEKVAQDARDPALAALARGEAAFVTHRFGDAQAAFTKAIEGARDPGPALLERARLALATGKDAALALEDANRALAAAPSSARALVLRARARARRMQEGERPPIPDLDRAIEVDGLCADAWAWRSVLRYRAGDAAGAIED